MKSNHAAAAAMIRKHLKANNIKARVRASSYSMGSSVTVTILEDVLPATADVIRGYVNQFQYGSFDGMTDSYDYDNRREDLPQVKFTFVELERSDEIKAEAREYLSHIDGLSDYEREDYVHRVLNGSWGDFYATRKPRVKVAA
jgi:hypothetical protein